MDVDLPVTPYAAELLTFLGRKLARLVLLLGALSVVSFTLVSLSPFDPVNAYVGADMLLVGPEQRARIAERWGLNDPPVERYLRWLGRVVQGDLGVSLIYRQPVARVIGQRFLASLGLMATAWAISGVLGFGLGVLAGARAGSPFDRVVRWLAYLLASTPTFWLALLLLIVFSVTLKWTPICCAGPPGVPAEEVTLLQRLHHLLLPAGTLSILGIANVTLHTRQKLIGVLNSDYVLYARAQGETPRGVIWLHGLRNIALPAVTLQFASLSELFGGSVLAEQVFAYPGLGQATTQAGLRGDVPLLLGIVLFSAVFVFVGNTLADLVYRLLDPRIRLGDSL
ncbi:MAG: ABC transporter permease [Anaerolineae bacterium]|nr:ABC transporter permease [Anaerolineae bacterium]